MQFTWLSVKSESSEIIDSVSDIGGLLDFCDEAAFADAVDTTCRKEGRKNTSPDCTL